VDFQLGRSDEGDECDGFADMKLRLGDVFRRIMRRDDDFCRGGGFEGVRLTGRRTLEDHVET